MVEEVKMSIPLKSYIFYTTDICKRLVPQINLSVITATD